MVSLAFPSGGSNVTFTVLAACRLRAFLFDNWPATQMLVILPWRLNIPDTTLRSLQWCPFALRLCGFGLQGIQLLQ